MGISDIPDAAWLNPNFDADRGQAENYRGNLALPSRGGPSGAHAGPQTGMDGLNVPSKPIAPKDGGANTQASRRWTDTYFDIHRNTGRGRRFPNGRPWTGERELSANPDLRQDPGFCSPDLMQGEYVKDENEVNDRFATFASVWHAPWVPLSRYFQFNHKRKLISFAYQAMAQHEDAAEVRYYEAAAILGQQTGQKVVFKEVPPFSIVAQLGMPKFYGDVARAAMAGDPWILGFIDEPNPKLAKVLGLTEHGFRTLSYDPAEAVATPEQVIAAHAAGPDDLKALMERMEAMQAELAALRAEKASEKPKHKGGRPRKTQHAPVTVNPAEQPAA